MLYKTLALTLISVLLVVGMFVGTDKMPTHSIFPGLDDGIYTFKDYIELFSRKLSDFSNRSWASFSLLSWILLPSGIAWLLVEQCVIFLGAGFMLALGIMGFAFTFLFIPTVSVFLLPFFIGLSVFSIAHKQQEKLGYSQRS